MTRFGLLLTVAAGFAVVSFPAQEALAVCCGANCCCIDGTVQSAGEANPANSCQTCNPSSSVSSWTDTPGCMTGGDDMGPGTPPDDDDGGCSAAGGNAYGFGLAALALLFVRRRRAS